MLVPQTAFRRENSGRCGTGLSKCAGDRRFRRYLEVFAGCKLLEKSIKSNIKKDAK